MNSYLIESQEPILLGVRSLEAIGSGEGGNGRDRGVLEQEGSSVEGQTDHEFGGGDSLLQVVLHAELLGGIF